MIVIFKNKEGKLTARPAFIGFIKNDIIRRTLCILFYPIIIVLTIDINLIQASVHSLIMFVNAIWHPLTNTTSFRKSELWKRPRTKADKNSGMDQGVNHG